MRPPRSIEAARATKKIVGFNRLRLVNIDISERHFRPSAEEINNNKASKPFQIGARIESQISRRKKKRNLMTNMRKSKEALLLF